MSGIHDVLVKEMLLKTLYYSEYKEVSYSNKTDYSERKIFYYDNFHRLSGNREINSN